MGLINWLIVIVLAGILAKVITPGRDSAGWSLVPIVGACGTSIGAVAAGHLGMQGLTGPDLYALSVASVGAVVAQFGYRVMFDLWDR